MKLEVGKSYRTRDGDKVTIAARLGCGSILYWDSKIKYAYEENGDCFNANKTHDLISEWVEPAKYKEGDVVTIELNETQAIMWNREHFFKIISHTPAPEPEFDWSTVKPKDVFRYKNGTLKYYLAENPWNEFVKNSVLCCDISGKLSTTLCLEKSELTRSPENDIEV